MQLTLCTQKATITNVELISLEVNLNLIEIEGWKNCFVF